MSREYHWILTLQSQSPDGRIGTANGSGVVTPNPGQTRQDLFQQAFQYVCDQSGITPARSNVLFFSLEPNELP